MSWLLDMANDSSLLPMNGEYGHDMIADHQAFWKAPMDAGEGQEGVTPYLYEQQFAKAEDVLDDENSDVDTELIFDSINEAFTWRTERRAFNPQSLADLTIPRTVRQKKAAVKLLFKAYKSVALAADNAGMLKTFLEQRHDNRQVETICWSIVEGCIDRCNRGPLLSAFEPDKAKNNASIRSFAERLDAVVESLSQQKTICKHLLDAPYLNRFLDDPVGSKQRVESNRKLNKRKGGVMDVGKKALGLSSKRGRSSDKQSDGASGDEVDKNSNEDGQLAQGKSFSESGLVHNPREQNLRANLHGAPPHIGSNHFHSGKLVAHDRSTQPHPAYRGGRGPNNTAGLVESRVLHAPQVRQYGNRGDSSSNSNVNSQRTSNMLPAHGVNSGMPAYSSPHTHAMTSTSRGTMGLGFERSPYVAHSIGTYHSSYANNDFANNDYASIATPAPFQPYDGYDDLDAGSRVESTSASNDANDSDDEYLPSRSGMKRRWH